MVDMLELPAEIQEHLAQCVEDLTTAGRLCLTCRALQVLLAQRIVQLVAARRNKLHTAVRGARSPAFKWFEDLGASRYLCWCGDEARPCMTIVLPQENAPRQPRQRQPPLLYEQSLYSRTVKALREHLRENHLAEFYALWPHAGAGSQPL